MRGRQDGELVVALNRRRRLKTNQFAPFFLTLLLSIVSLPFASNGVAAAPQKSQYVSSENFLSSDFAAYFKQGKYPEALKALDRLIVKHPNDPLLLRYRAVVLEKLGRRAEAIAVYRQILADHPNHVPTHLFLGLAYAKQGQREGAARQLRWVIENSESEEYQHWAQAQLARLRAKGRKPRKKIEQKPYLLGKIKIAYDSNPLLVPDEESLSSRTREDGVLYGLNLDVGYPFLLEKDKRVDILYIGRAVLHDGGTDQVNFATQGVALDAKQRTFFGNRAVVLGERYDFRANFLRSDLFSIVNRLVLSADTSFWKRTRTHFYGRGSYSDYGPDGSRPGVTSRDGVRGGLGVVQYFYTADLRSYVFLKQEVSAAETRGDNFDRKGYLARLGVHAPLDRKSRMDLDTSVGFDRGTYPDFSSLSTLDPADRRDTRLDAYAALTYHWKPDLATRGFYRFIASDNRNDFFDRQRHIAGVEMVFSL